MKNSPTTGQWVFTVVITFVLYVIFSTAANLIPYSFQVSKPLFIVAITIVFIAHFILAMIVFIMPFLLLNTSKKKLWVFVLWIVAGLLLAYYVFPNRTINILATPLPPDAEKITYSFQQTALHLGDVSYGGRYLPSVFFNTRTNSMEQVFKFYKDTYLKKGFVDATTSTEQKTIDLKNDTEFVYVHYSSDTGIFEVSVN